MIDLSLSAVQSDLAASFREVAAAEFPREDGTTAAMEGPQPFDEGRWQRLAEGGLFGVAIPEESGGIGLGTVEEMLTFIELGRVAASGPLVSTVLAAQLAVSSGNEEIAEALISGERRAGLLVGDRVVDAGQGDLAVRVGPAGADVVAVESATPLDPVDGLTTVARVEASKPVFSVEDTRLQLRLRILVAAYLVGLAEATTEMSVEYAKTREQFGKPIGTFQAVKHRCSEMAIRAYEARAQLAMGAVLFDGQAPHDGRLEVDAGYLLAVDAGRRNAEDNVQNHGGIGFTAEHPAGVYVKRAQVYRNLAGAETDLVREILDTPRTSIGVTSSAPALQ